MKHYVNETGTSFILDTGALIGTAADQKIYYRKPGGVEGTWSATLYSSYSELAAAIGTYLLTHTLAYTDLDTSGEWRFQAWVASASGTWWGEMVKLNIFDQFE